VAFFSLFLTSPLFSRPQPLKLNHPQIRTDKTLRKEIWIWRQNSENPNYAAGAKLVHAEREG
jgi:hypothetical protein